MYKWIRKKKRENLQDVKLVQTRCQNVSMSKIDRCNRWAIFLYVKSQSPKIGQPWWCHGVSWRGESREVTKLLATAWLKMKDACILPNAIEIFWQKKITKIERWKLSNSFKLQMALTQLYQNILACLYRYPNIPIAKRRNWSVGCQSRWFILVFHKSS